MTTIRDVNRRFSVKQSDRMLAVSSFSFDLSVYDVFGLLSVGGMVVFPEPGRSSRSGSLVRTCRTRRVTLWNSVPALFEMLTSWQKQI